MTFLYIILSFIFFFLYVVIVFFLPDSCNIKEHIVGLLRVPVFIIVVKLCLMYVNEMYLHLKY